MRKSPLFSVIINCALEENLNRLTADSRGRTKLDDVEILKEIRKTEDLYRFGGELELELDASDVPAQVLAQKIYDFVVMRGSTRVY